MISLLASFGVLGANRDELAAKGRNPDILAIQEEVLPAEGYVFPIKWGDLGKRMVADGIIDERKLAKDLVGSDTLPYYFEQYLDDSGPDRIELKQDNAGFWIDVLWGLGLANKNDILETGPMVEGGDTDRLASTAGYEIGVKKPMDIYDKFSYITLSPEQQATVKEVAGNIYRPCCSNSTAFPDCNHGMAALGLIELMVSQGFSKDDIYRTVLAFNSFWFPQTYMDIDYYYQKKGKDYKQVPASEVLSISMSSGGGYQALKRQIGQVPWPGFHQSGC
ncbi:MAG: hypothetical protein M1531_11170 [Chloroflexi bacterium]|nr:hypothetical protein [Chloroflexota bacterium]